MSEQKTCGSCGKPERRKRRSVCHECHKEYMSKYTKEYRMKHGRGPRSEHKSERYKERRREATKEMNDNYIKKRISICIGLKGKDIPPDLIKVYRANLALKREVRKIDNKLKNKKQ